MELVFQ